MLAAQFIVTALATGVSTTEAEISGYAPVYPDAPEYPDAPIGVLNTNGAAITITYVKEI